MLGLLLSSAGCGKGGRLDSPKGADSAPVPRKKTPLSPVGNINAHLSRGRSRRNSEHH